MIAKSMSGKPTNRTSMLQNLYSLFIQPRMADTDRAEREIVLNFLLIGMIGLASVALLATLVSYIFFGYDFIIPRIVGVLLTGSLFVGPYLLSRYLQKQKLAATLFIGIAFVCANYMVYHWGLLVPTALVLYSLVIVMAGILQGAKYSLYMAFAIAALLAMLQYAKAVGWVNPDLAWMQSSSTLGDVLGFSALFMTIALVSWLFNRQMEQSLVRARSAEAALLRQNEGLEEKVKERTEQLEKEQMEKIQQMYRFAELGHVSTALFHDLANHVSSVSIDIESLQRGKKSDLMQRIDENIRYIDDIVRRVRLQLQGKNALEPLDVEREIKEVVRVATRKGDASPTIELEVASLGRPIVIRGNVLRFRQVLTNLLCNAVDACTIDGRKTGRVTIAVSETAGGITLTITDNGPGIPTVQQEKVFDPFYSSKKEGIGIGLFIVRQIIERDFGGTITFTSSRKNGTTFTVFLPQKGQHGPAKN